METAAYLMYHEMNDTSRRCTCAPYTTVGRQVSPTQGDVAGVPQECVIVFCPTTKRCNNPDQVLWQGRIMRIDRCIEPLSVTLRVVLMFLCQTQDLFFLLLYFIH